MCSRIHYLNRTQRLPISQDVAWAFFSNPANLLQLTPPWAAMRDESHEHPKTIYPGLIQVYRLKLPGGFPVRWLAEITHVDAPGQFIDEQKDGPFAFWHHRHAIKTIEGGVEVTDAVHYAMPLGFLGEMAHALMIRRELERVFDYRAAMLEDFFGSF